MEYFGVTRFSLLALWFLLRPNGNSLWSSGRSFFLHFWFSIFNFHFICLRMIDRGKEDNTYLFFCLYSLQVVYLKGMLRLIFFFLKGLSWLMSSMIHDLNKVRDHVGFIHHHQYIFFMARLSGYLIWDGIVSCLVWCGVVTLRKCHRNWVLGHGRNHLNFDVAWPSFGQLEKGKPMPLHLVERYFDTEEDVISYYWEIWEYFSSANLLLK